MITIKTTVEELVTIASENKSHGESGTLFYTFPTIVSMLSFGDETHASFGCKLVLATQMYSVYAESETSNEGESMKDILDNLIREFPYTSLNVSSIENKNGIIEINHL